jgi:hypothetical protein
LTWNYKERQTNIGENIEEIKKDNHSVEMNDFPNVQPTCGLGLLSVTDVLWRV